MQLLSRLTPKIIYFATLITVLGAMGFVALYLAVGPGLPDVESIRKIRLQTPMSIYASDGQLIDEFGDKRRIPITLDQVPKDFINALLATEDQRFYEHSGVDIWGVLRALERLVTTQTKSQGASTITMQVARNYYLTREKRFSRKFTEMFLAWKIESELSKNEILELFLNKIHFGHRAYGLGAAAQVYYGTTLDQLSIARLATLAGVLKGESKYNPISSPPNASIRRKHVLGRMLDERHITQEQYELAMAEPIKTEKHGASRSVDAPFLAEMVRREVIQQFGREKAYNDGLKIYTTLDSRLQANGQIALNQGLEAYDRRHGYRGAEQKFQMNENTSQETLLEWLTDISSVAGLKPAIVMSLGEASANLLIESGEIIKLPLESFKWARSYIDENHRGKPIKTAEQVFQIGDLVRVKLVSDSKEDGQQSGYKLAQVPDVSGGLVSLAPLDGAIQTLIGGYDFSLNQFNMVTQARRQAGSNIKPFVYSAAFNKDYTPASMINDMPIVEADITAENFWRPKNDSDKYAGPTSLRRALTLSKNTVSVRLVREIGARYTKKYLEDIGFPGEHMSPYLSLALGSASFTPLEVATGYAILANGGYKVAPYFIQRIENANGRILFEAQPIKVCRACEETIESQMQKALETEIRLASVESNTAEYNETSITSNLPQADPLADEFTNLPQFPLVENKIAPRVIEARNHFLVNNILQDVIHKGTAWRTLYNSKSPLLKRQDLAGKTGTTNDAKDAWFSGYNLNHVATAWVGFSDHEKKLGSREFGGKAALPIWQTYMELTLADTPPSYFERPEGLVTVRIDPASGLLATSMTVKPKFELFRSENAPTEYAEKPIEDIFNNDDSIEDENIF